MVLEVDRGFFFSMHEYIICYIVFQGHYGCPNKSNIYHECTTFCEERWGQGIIDPDPSYMRKKQRMLLKYPLPENWVEIYDPGT